MKVLELFCGLGGWSKPWVEMGHDVTGIDITDFSKEFPGKFIKADLLEWEPGQHYDIVLASPPCTEFSIAKKWGYGTQDERIGLDLVYRAFYLISKIKPKYYVIENVKGLGEFLPPPQEKIRYMRHKSSKWAYLWTNIPPLGFFPQMIDYETAEALLKKHNNEKFKDISKRMGRIPYQVSKAVYTNMTLTDEGECLERPRI